MDTAKFTKLYESLKIKVYRYVFYKIRNSAVAEDITSEVFLKFYKEYMTNALIMDYAQAWIYRAAYNMVIDHARSSHYKKTNTMSEMERVDEESSSGDTIEQEFADEDVKSYLETAIKDEKVKSIHTALLDLKQPEREIIDLRIFQELPFTDISVILDIAEGAAKMRYKRAVNKLKYIVDANVVPKKQ